MLIRVFPFCAYLSFIIYNIFNTLLSQKYVIEYKKNTSPIWLFTNKHIFLFINSIWHTQNTTERYLHCTAMHRSSMYRPGEIPRTPMHCSAMHHAAIPCTSMHHTSMHHSAMHQTAMHSTPRHHRSPQERPELFCECPNMPADRFYRFFRV